MQCTVISSISLDKKSIEGIERIKSISGFPEVLTKVLAYGTFVNIFLGNKVPELTFNIYQTDWSMLHQSMMALPSIQRRRISDIARYQIIDHQMYYKQLQFWKGISDGCEIK